ncbi:MAG: extracellular solute-binding protein [Treponema sp.]|nr:extracellular solute-binding protein [Treponema sp.]
MKKLLLALVILMVAMAFVTTGCKSEPEQLTVQIFDRGTDGGRSIAHDNAWMDWIKEKVKADLNIDVTFVPVGRWSEGTDMVNLMASMSAPDLCYTYNLGMVNSFRDQGGILNLAPFVDRYLPDLKILLGEDTAIAGKEFIYRDADPQTGHIYSIPSYRVALAQRNVFVRKDWLDALGMAVPTNTQQFYEMLVAFRDRDPGNVGRNRVVPFGVNSDVRWGLANLIQPSIDANISDRDRWVLNVADRNIAMPGYKEGTRMMNQWYNEGLIYRDFPLMTVADDFYNMIKSGVVGAFCQNWDLPYRTDYNIIGDLRRNVPNADFIPVDAITSADGVTRKDMFDKAGLRIFIPSFSKNHIAALRYLNWLAKPENYQFIQIGHEGLNHVIENGVPRLTAAPPGDPWFVNSAMNIDITMPMNGIELGSTELNARVLALGYGGFDPNVIVNAYQTSIRNARAAAVWQATTTVNQYDQTLQTKADDLITQAIRARPADFDRVWDAGYADWLNSGAQEVLNERSSLYPR